MNRLKKVLAEYYDHQADEDVKKVQIIGGGPHDGSIGTVVAQKGKVVDVKLDNGKSLTITADQRKEI